MDRFVRWLLILSSAFALFAVDSLLFALNVKPWIVLLAGLITYEIVLWTGTTSYNDRISRLLPLTYVHHTIEEGEAIEITFNDDFKFHSAWLFVVKNFDEGLKATLCGLNDIYNQAAFDIYKKGGYRYKKETINSLNEMRTSYLNTLFTEFLKKNDNVDVTKFIKEGHKLKIEEMDARSIIKDDKGQTMGSTDNAQKATE